MSSEQVFETRKGAEKHVSERQPPCYAIDAEAIVLESVRWGTNLDLWQVQTDLNDGFLIPVGFKEMSADDN